MCSETVDWINERKRKWNLKKKKIYLRCQQEYEKKNDLLPLHNNSFSPKQQKISPILMFLFFFLYTLEMYLVEKDFITHCRIKIKTLITQLELNQEMKYEQIPFELICDRHQQKARLNSSLLFFFD